MKIDSKELKWVRQASLEGMFNLQWTTPREDLLRDFYKPRKQRRMEEFKGEYMVKKFSLIMYLFMNNLEFPKEQQML